MPYMQAMTLRANALLGGEPLKTLDPVVLAPGANLADAAKKVGIVVRDEEYAFLNSWPAGLKEAIRALLYNALTREPRLPVTIAWTPGYDFGLTASEAAGTPRSVGGMTIVLQSRYPDDSVPVAS